MTRLKLPLLVGAAALTLTACSNNPDEPKFSERMKKLLTRQQAAKAQTAGEIDIDALLKATAPKPLMMATLKDRGNAKSVLLEIERNGAYRTYSTPFRQTIVTRQGLVIATRGLGDDLMATVASDSKSLIRARRAGKATRVMDFLNAAGDTLRYSFSCEMTVTGTAQVKQGAVNSSTTEMTETCTAAQYQFTNTYNVDGSGEILASQQWLGAGLGTAEMKVLRR